MKKKTWAKVAIAASTMSVAVGTLAAIPAQAKSAPALVVFSQSDPGYQKDFNPFVVNNAQNVQGEVYQPLFYFSTDGGKTYAQLGTSYKWINSKTLDVTLRKNVKWNDGKPFSINDVLFTYNLLKKYPAIDTASIWAHLSSVTKVNGDTVQFSFKTTDVPFATEVIGQVAIVPQHIWANVKNPATFTDANPVGTGPYMLNKFASQEYSLKRNPSYYGKQPAAPEVEYPALSGNDSADLQMVSGNLDWTDLFVSNIQQNYVSKDPSTNHYWFGANGIVSLVPNMKNPLLADPAVREAISLAINRTDIYKLGEYGYEVPSNPTGLVTANDQAWIDPKVAKTFTYSTSQAESVLKSAGYSMDSNGVMAKGGKELSFNLIAPAGWTDWNEDQNLIKQELSAIGIQINVQTPAQDTWQNDLNSGTFDLAVHGSYVEIGSTPFYGYYQYLTKAGGFDYEQYNNAAVNKAINTFQTSTNAATEKQAMYTVETQIAKDLPIIPLVDAASWYEYSTRNYTGWPNASNPYVDAPPYDAFATGIVLTHLKLK